MAAGVRALGECELRHNLARLNDEIAEVHKILGKYIRTHDAIFKASWRKVIPLPGLFKPIRYAEHAMDLDLLIPAMHRIISCLSSKCDVPDILFRYVLALIKAMTALRALCELLDAKSRGDSRDYTLSRHKMQIAEYEGLIEGYRSLGAELNRFIEQ